MLGQGQAAHDDDEAWWCIKAYKHKMICFQLLKIKLYPSFICLVESDKRPLKKFVARAGTNLTLPCTGAVGEKSALKIEKLTWKSSQTIIKFINGRPLEQNQRVSVASTCHETSHLWKWYQLILNLFCLFVQPFSEITESEKFQFTFQSSEVNR